MNASQQTSQLRPEATPGRRLVAFAVAALWFVSQIALPGWHLSHHDEAHRQAAARCAETLDVESVRDPQSGHVDLARLADALQCGPASHSHDPDRPLDGSDGVVLHFGVITLSPQVDLPLPAHEPVWREFVVVVSAGRVVPAPLTFLSSQRSQAPPA